MLCYVICPDSDRQDKKTILCPVGHPRKGHKVRTNYLLSVKNSQNRKNHLIQYTHNSTFMQHHSKVLPSRQLNFRLFSQERNNSAITMQTRDAMELSFLHCHWARYIWPFLSQLHRIIV